MLNSCTRTNSGALLNLLDTMNESYKQTSSGVMNILTLIHNEKKRVRGVWGLGKQPHKSKQTHAKTRGILSHTHKHANAAHTTVAKRITQHITDPVNYMWPLPEVRGHSQ